MSDLQNAVPVPNPDKSALTSAGLAILAAVVPVVGGVVASGARESLSQRSANRQYEFNLMVVAELERVAGLKAEDVLDSDEFMAMYEKVSRMAAEATSKEKRQRLAEALRHCGPWDTSTEPIQRARFIDFIDRYSDLHIFLLEFFHNPAAWLAENAPTFDVNNYFMVSIEQITSQFVFPDIPFDNVANCLAELERDRLTSVPLKAGMTGLGAVAPRNTPLGDAFLGFIGQTPSE